MLYVSGSIGLDPATMKLVGPGVEEQASQVMRNLEAILRAAGCSFSDVVKTTILLTDIADFAAVNKIYGREDGVEIEAVCAPFALDVLGGSVALPPSA